MDSNIIKEDRIPDILQVQDQFPISISNKINKLFKGI